MNKEQLLKDLEEAKQAVESAKAKVSSIEQQLKEDDKLSAEQFIIDCIEGCIIHRDADYPDSVFYMKEEKAWFEIRKPHLWVSYNNVWKVLANQYGLSYHDIQSLIKDVVEKHFKWEGLTPGTVAATTKFGGNNTSNRRD